MTDAVIQVQEVSVKYNKTLVLTQISFEVARGSVYALLGRNGAGKSSLIRCLLGLQKPTTGHVRLFGEDVWTHRARLMEKAAYVPETSDAPVQVRVRDVEAFHKAMYASWDAPSVRERLDRANIGSSMTVSALSKGQRAIFALALALASRPELLVLDDPTLGLDVVARNDFFSTFIGDLADRGTTVILTTHDLAGVEGIADRVGILQGARLALDDDMETMKTARGQSLEAAFTEITHSPRSDV
jgi:ABC-2 type transport system ATP-binding protein